MSLEALRIAASAACLLAGIALLRRGLATTTAWLLLGCAVMIPLARLPEASPAPVFALSLVLTAIVPAGAAVAGLCWPVRPSTRTERAAIASAFLSAGVVSGLAPALLLDRRAAGCNRCPANLLAISAAPDLVVFLDRAALVLTIGWGSTLALLAARKWVRAPRLVRRHTWPMLLGGAAVALLAATAAGHALALAQDDFDPFAEPAWNLELALLVLMTGGVWFRLILPRTMAGRVARAVLTATPTSTTLVDSLARAVGDPGLVLTYCRLNGARIDPAGRPVPAPEDSAVLRLTRDGRPYAEIWYSTRLRSTADLVHTVATTSGIALEYIAAQARLRAEALDAAAARQRIVIKADAERKRLERDLHDGAQQGLIALSMQLTAAAAAASDQRTAQRFHAAQQEITDALQGLRSVARGLFPVSLDEGGLHAALRELGDHTPVPLLVEGCLTGSLSHEADMAIYHLVLDVVNVVPAGAGAFVQVALRGGGSEPARILITTPPADPERTRRLVLRSEDRLMALGGELTIGATAAAQTLTGEVPCGS